MSEREKMRQSCLMMFGVFVGCAIGGVFASLAGDWWLLTPVFALMYAVYFAWRATDPDLERT